MAVATAAELQPVADMSQRLQALLDQARSVKLEARVEPPLPTTELLDHVESLHDDFSESCDQAYRFASVETAAREIFYSLVSATDIDDLAFVEVWNLLDILLVCSDQGKCAPELVCWLIEELIDSQTTHGCRTVFDYLESRRERLAQKDFHKKNLVFLRSCNELLRRLSRAEDAIFCGRVFFFLFQTFPLGDKSSVNLRGEFHVENTTKFEVSELQPEQDGEKMEIDSQPIKVEPPASKATTPQPPTKPGSKAVPIKPVPKQEEKKKEEAPLSTSELYPIFWRLQQDFCEPTRLFASDNFNTFKKGLAHTIRKFQITPTVVQTRVSEDGRRGTKRKLGDNGSNGVDGEGSDHFVDNYNPKYLTSRDLFDLELSDLAFQRHILVQAQILLDFLLSLTERAKKRLASVETPNKSMLYSFTLSEDDAKWASTTRSKIRDFLSVTIEGRLFNRMVETVLARDKNWIRWKVESCPSIVRDPVSTESELEARKRAKDATRVRRVPEKRPGAMDLSFLDEGNGGGLEALKNPSRFTAPSIDELIDGIKTDELDLEMAMDDEETAGLQNAIANKRWRALRHARKTKLEVLDRVEPGKDLEAVFRPPAEPELQVTIEAEEHTNGELEVVEKLDEDIVDGAGTALDPVEEVMTVEQSDAGEKAAEDVVAVT